MAGRPLKDGLAYYQHDVNMSADEKLEALEAVHGNDGYAVYNKLLERIYKSFGKLSLADDVQRLSIAKKCNVPVEKFDLIISDAVRFGLFDRDAWETEKRLTSERIRRQLDEVESERETWRVKSKGKIPLQPQLSPEKMPIISGDNCSDDGGKCDKAEQNRIESSRARANLQEPGVQEGDEELYFFALEFVKTKRKAARPEEMARAIMHDPDVLTAFQKARTQKTPATTLAPDPGPCPKCGGERKADRYIGEARCLKCSTTYTYERSADEWIEDSKPTEIVVFADTG